MTPIYKPKGKAKEYGDYAINIYTGCPHRCYYCFAPSVLRKDREAFHTNVEPRKGIVEAVNRQLDKEQLTGKLIHLCFTCDPYPKGCDNAATREVIKAIKDAGNHVQILTKGDGGRDFDLLDENDWYGVSISCYGTSRVEPGALHPLERTVGIGEAKRHGIKTWVSCEPVINDKEVLHLISESIVAPHVDRWKIGKLNYHPSDIDWATFGAAAERICKELGIDYYIKDSLRAEMEKSNV